jgi:hypothetical protein
MWKSHFNVDGKGIVFHKGCGKHCGNLWSFVEIFPRDKFFHFSTGRIFSTLWKCGKLEAKGSYTKNLTDKHTVDKIYPKVELSTCKDCP